MTPKTHRGMTRIALRNVIANNTKRGNTMADEKSVKAATETVNAVNELLPVMTVTLDQINADPRFNVRQNYTEKTEGKTLTEEESIAKLAESIETDGQLTPLIVTRNAKGGYDLVAGFRRFKALSLLAKQTKKEGAKQPITARVQIKSFDKPVAAHYLNVRENTERQQLKPYDIAKKAAFIKQEYEESGANIARNFGLDRNYVNNLMRLLSDLDARIVDAWAEEHPKATMNNLLPLAPKPHADQWDKWQIMIGAVSEEGEEGEEGGEGDEGGGASDADKKPKRPSLSTLEAAIETISKDKDAEPEWRKGALAALKFAAGKSGKVGSYDPKKARAEKGKGKGKDADTTRADA